MPNVPASKSACKTTMLPRMIEVVVDINPASVMPHPLAVGVNVRGVRMPLSVSIIAVLLSGVNLLRSLAGRTLLGDVLFAILSTLLFAAVIIALTLSVLGQCRDGKHQSYREN